MSSLPRLTQVTPQVRSMGSGRIGATLKG